MTMFQNLNRSLHQGQTLKVACAACPHQARWSREQAVSRLGPDAIPADVRRRLTCGVCGAPAPRVWI